MREPKPRDARFMGMHERANINPDGTWLEPESMTYPSGGFHRRAYVVIRKNEHNPIELPYEKKYVVICSIADSYFSIPARFKYRGRTIKGYISVPSDNPTLTFTPEADPILCPNCTPGNGCKRG